MTIIIVNVNKVVVLYYNLSTQILRQTLDLVHVT